MSHDIRFSERVSTLCGGFELIFTAHPQSAADTEPERQAMGMGVFTFLPPAKAQLIYSPALALRSDFFSVNETPS